MRPRVRQDRVGPLIHRWYEYQTGRYGRPDPLGLSAGINLYSYSWPNPVTSFDVDGQASLGRLLNPVWLPPKFPAKAGCAGKALAELTIGGPKFGDFFGWRFQHCAASCYLVRECGLSQDAVRRIGNLVEEKQVLECLLLGDNCHSAKAPRDYLDNEQGLTCPPNVDCFDRCKEQLGRDKTEEEYGPYTGKETQPIWRRLFE